MEEHKDCALAPEPGGWIAVDINTAAERDAVCLALLHSGHAVRTRRRKEGNRTVIYLEYRR